LSNEVEVDAGGSRVSPEVTQPCSKESVPPDAGHAQVSSDSPGEPDCANPYSAELDPAEPDVARADAAQSDSAKSDSAKPDAAKADAAKADAANPEAARPDASISAKPDGAARQSRSRRRLRRTSRMAAALTVVGGLAVVIFVLKPGRLVQGAGGVEEITVGPRSIAIEVNSTGALRATSVQNYGGPPGFGSYWQFQLVSMVPEGKNVKKGETLISFDAQKINQDLQQFQNELEQANKELERTRVQIDLERQDLVANLAQAENKYAMLKLKQSPFPELAKSNDIETDKLALEEARQEVESIKEWIEWHKKSSEATYKIIESKKARAQLKVDEIRTALGNFQAKADRDGVAVYKLKWNGDRFQVGENVWTGQPIIEIPDLNTIIAEAFIPEVDIGKVAIGQRAEVAIDALPGKSYSGHVSGIGRLVHPKSWDIPNRILEVQIGLDQLDTSIMRPAMSVKVKIETASLSNVFAVPLRAVHQTEEGWLVKVKSDSGWRDRAVKLGASNATDVVIADGVKNGERIATDYGKAK
jgi:multidrug resistance efflux pump